MHRTKEYIVECADPDCRNRVKTTSHRKEKLCPECARARQTLYQKRRRQRAKEIQNDHHNPDVALERKLDSCEYCIQYDAAPEEESFPEGAKVSYLELNHLLRNEFLLSGSLVRQCKTNKVFEITRSKNTGNLYLKLISPTQLGRPPSL